MLGRRTRILLSAFLLAMIVSKTVAIVMRGPVPIELDAAEYWRLSTSVMQGDVFLLSRPIAYRTPIYPWFLAAIRAIFQTYSLVAIVAIQALLSVGSVWVASRLAVRITRLPRAMLITLLISLPAVAAITFSAAILSETLFVFLLMIHLSAVQRYAQRPSSASAVWAATTFAVTLLTRPIAMLLWVPHLIYLLLVYFRQRTIRSTRFSRRVVHLGIAALTTVVFLSPWLVRNQVVFGKPFLTEFLGRNLWIVTFQDGSGAGLAVPDTSAGLVLRQRLDRVGVKEDRDLTWTVSKGLRASGLNDPQTDRLMKEVAVDAIRIAPRQFTLKAIERTINFWRTRATVIPRQTSDGNFRHLKTWGQGSWLIDWIERHRLSNVLWFNTFVLMMVGISGLIVAAHRISRPEGIWLMMVLAYFSIVTGVFEIPAYRYRMVMEPVACCVIAAAIAILMSRRTARAVTVQ